MTVAVYLRKSRAEENAPVSDTLARHREILTEFAKKQGLTITHVYEEVASGDSLYGRPEMLKLLEKLPVYDAVLCMDIDRLGRGAMYEQGLIFEAFRSAGVLIVTPAKTYDMRDDMDDSLISFKALFAREEYKMIRGRLRRGTIKAIEEGCYLSNAPFGYRQTRANKKPTLEIVPEEAEGVKLIFTLYCGGQGCQSVADTIHALGFRPRRGQKFNRTTIAKIIRNPVYIGNVVWNQYRCDRPKKPGQKHVKRLKSREEWKIVPGLHDPIIERPVFEEANKRMSGRYHPPYNKGIIKNPFAGILFCGNCGMSIVRQMSSKQYNQPMMLCPTAGCMMGSSLSVVEDIFFDALTIALGEIKTLPESAPLPAVIDMAENARAELSRLRQQSAKLHDLLEQGVYDVGTFVARRDELNARIKTAQDIIASEKRFIDKVELIERIESLLSRYWDGTPRERNQMLKSVIRKSTYIKKKGSGWKTEPVIEITEWRD